MNNLNTILDFIYSIIWYPFGAIIIFLMLEFIIRKWKKKRKS